MIKITPFPPMGLFFHKRNGDDCEYCPTGRIEELEGLQLCRGCGHVYWITAFHTLLANLKEGEQFILVGDNPKNIFAAGKHPLQNNPTCNVHYVDSPEVNAFLRPDVAVRRLTDRYIGDTFSRS